MVCPCIWGNLKLTNAMPYFNWQSVYRPKIKQLIWCSEQGWIGPNGWLIPTSVHHNFKNGEVCRINNHAGSRRKNEYKIIHIYTLGKTNLWQGIFSPGIHDGNKELQITLRTLSRIKELLVSVLGGGCYILHKFKISFLYKVRNRKK